MSFDRDAVRLLRIQLQLKLDELSKALDFDIRLGSARFSQTNVTFKLEVSKVGNDGVAENRAVTDFKRLASSYGLKAEDLHKEFTMMGKQYRIVGLMPRRHAYPLLIEHNGKQYKASAEQVRSLLK